MSYVKIWVHAVWGTKNHEKILQKNIRYDLFQHIRENAREKSIYVDFINEYKNGEKMYHVISPKRFQLK